MSWTHKRNAPAKIRDRFRFRATCILGWNRLVKIQSALAAFTFVYITTYPVSSDRQEEQYKNIQCAARNTRSLPLASLGVGRGSAHLALKSELLIQSNEHHTKNSLKTYFLFSLLYISIPILLPTPSKAWCSDRTFLTSVPWESQEFWMTYLIIMKCWKSRSLIIMPDLWQYSMSSVNIGFILNGKHRMAMSTEHAQTYPTSLNTRLTPLACNFANNNCNLNCAPVYLKLL